MSSSPRPAPPPDDALHSVGQVASETGISPGTLRMWERRYGAPVPVRLPSGHRRYTADQVRLMRRVAEAMARGHRPGKLLRLDEAELDRLLAGPADERTPEAVEPWVDLALAYDERGLEAALWSAAAALSPLEYLHGRVAPFVRAVGRLWADGQLDVHHEHFATHAVETVLRSLRASLREQPGVPERGRMLLTTLPGERHGLGLEMVAILCEAAGVRTHMLGTDTPLDEIARSAREHAVQAVGVSVSLAGGGVRTDPLLAELRDALPEGTDLLVGGTGARGKRRGQRGVVYCEELPDLVRWLEERFAAPGRNGGR